MDENTFAGLDNERYEIGKLPATTPREARSAPPIWPSVCVLFLGHLNLSWHFKLVICRPRSSPLGPLATSQASSEGRGEGNRVFFAWFFAWFSVGLVQERGACTPTSTSLTKIPREHVEHRVFGLAAGMSCADLGLERQSTDANGPVLLSQVLNEVRVRGNEPPTSTFI